jgi:hypothetical protein
VHGRSPRPAGSPRLSDRRPAEEAVYHAAKNRALSQLSTALDNAVAPAFSFRPVTEVAASANGATPAGVVAA